MSLRWIVVDCEDPGKVARFWAAALEREIAEHGDGWASMPGDPHLFFVQVPETKTAKNRWHPDWDSPDREGDVQRLIGLGATRLADRTEEAMGLEWTSMADPEGNEFCVVRADVD
jgi:Glyoxalase-like domain